MRLAWVAALSFLFNYLFFLEYLRPLRRVHIPFDLEMFHLPLLDGAFRSLKAGRFPLWDSAIYCGISFAGNVQAALFYPPSWLLFLVNRGRENLSYVTLELFTVAHLWIAFVLCYAWLRGRNLSTLASLLGAGAFAYGGSTLLQLQHYGVTCGMAWLPLGLLAIDQAERSVSWRPLWKLAVASALCFLAGYAPAWCAFAICATVYAAVSRRPLRSAASAAAAIGLSLGLAAVQLLPAWHAAQTMLREDRYDAVTRDLLYHVAWFVPNFFRFGMHIEAGTNYGMEYLYLGGAALVGLALAVRAPVRSTAPLLAAGVASLALLVDAFGVPGKLIHLSPLLAHAVRSVSFLVVIQLIAAGIAAHGLDSALAATRRPGRRWIGAGAATLLVAWGGILLWRWFPGDAEFPHGWRSAPDALVMVALVAVAVFALRCTTGRARLVLAAALLFTVAVEYKVYGTSKRFNARSGQGENYMSAREVAGFNSSLLSQMIEHSEYRVVVDLSGPFPQLFRHKGLSSPQGFDPLYTAAYNRYLAGKADFRSNWEFFLDPAKPDILRDLGVRYFVSNDTAPLYPKLAHNPAFRRLQPVRGFYEVFELIDPSPPFRMDSPATITPTVRTPEIRGFGVQSPSSGRFVLVEQFFPGWSATLDGAPVQVQRHDGVFQSIAVPPGDHRIEFRYFPSGLAAGAVISLVSAILVAAIAFRKTTPAAPDGP